MQIKRKRELATDNNIAFEYVMNQGRICENPYDNACRIEKRSGYASEMIKLEEGEYLSDRIGESYVNWRHGDVIMMNVSCGRGKTTFCIKELYPYYLNNDYCIIYLCNRLSLKAQIIKDSADELSMHEYDGLPPEVLCNVKDFEGRVFFETYQGLGNIYKLNQKYRPECFDGKKVLLIMDEVHYFTSDCVFSTAPEYVFNGIQKQFSDAITIVMTATDWDVFDLIASSRPHTPDISMRSMPAQCYSPMNELMGQFDCKYYNQRNIQCRSCNVNYQKSAYYGYITNMQQGLKPIKQYYYDDGFDRTNVSAYYYQYKEELINKIKSSAEDEKWIIFTSSKSSGFSLKDKLNGLSINAEFIYSPDSCNELSANAIAEKNSIFSEEKFKSRVLISTAVLDCGTTIHDKSVTNIAIDCIDPVTTVQFIGRIRKDGQKMNLYFRNRTLKEVEDYLYEHIRKPLDDMRRLASSKEQRDCNEELLGAMMGNLLSSYDGKIHKNNFAERKLRNMQKYLAHIILGDVPQNDSSKPEDKDKSFLRHQLELFGFEPEECKYISHDEKAAQRKAICSCIESKLDTEMTKAQYTEFGKELDKLLTAAYGSPVIRGDGTHTTKKYNEIFQKYGIPFMVSKDSNNNYIFSAVSADEKYNETA